MPRLDIGLARSLVLSLVGLTPVALLGQTAKPNVAAVTNVASYSLGPVSAGEMVVIFGTAMGPSSLVHLQLDADGKVANTLADVQVLFDGVAAPLIYVWETQIAAMVPYGVVGKPTTQVQVVYRGVASDAFQKAIAPSAPGIFTADASGKGQAAMTNSDSQYNTSTHPAAPGEWVTFYLTGEGPIDPPGSDGTIATTTTQVVLPVVVRIAGREAKLLYAGSAPGNVNGFTQINVVVPPDLQYGGDLPLMVQVGDATSQTDVTVAVSGPPAPKPGTPLDVAATPNSLDRIVLTWTPADALATSFHIERKTGTDRFAEIANVPANSPTFTDGNVTPGTAYQYRVRAENDWGFSAYSGAVTATVIVPQLLPPSNVQATAISQNQVTLTWNGANTNAVQFQIERKAGSDAAFTLVATVPSSQTNYQDTGLVPNTTYVYRMRSQGTVGFSGYSNEGTATTLAPPPPPAPVLQATAMSSSQVRVSWANTATAVIRFRLERRGPSGTFTEIAQPGPAAASYDDTGLVASTPYTYRMRVETSSGISAYSNEASATTPAPPLPPAPALQATAISSAQIHLSWTSTATGVVRFRIERRLATTQYAEVNQPGPSSMSYDDVGLSAQTTYFYRIRVETNAGLSPYSNEVSVTTPQALPAAPSNLQAIAVSYNQANLTWKNNAPDATAIRVEYRPPASATFTDIGPAVSLTSTGVTGLQPNTSYTFRVRAQNGAGFSPYSNEATVSTPPIPKTVFLIHGIGQGSADMQGLSGSLTGSSGIDLTRFRVDAGFDFSECADTDWCSSDCSISGGAWKLAQYIANANPPGDIVLVGFSMGGLIARDLMANNRLTLNGRKVAALITLGTPNLGYPYTLIDTTLFCTPLVQQMDGNWRSQQASNTVVLSPYLLSLTNQWPSISYPGSGGIWFAASGRSCSNPTRTINATTGCRDRNPYSDGVVCDDSASYSISTSAGSGPNRYWQDPGQIYVHSNNGFGSSLILCGNNGQNPTLSNPPSFGPLFAALKGLINGL